MSAWTNAAGLTPIVLASAIAHRVFADQASRESPTIYVKDASVSTHVARIIRCLVASFKASILDDAHNNGSYPYQLPTKVNFD